MSIHYTDDAVTLWHGDCIEVMRQLPDASVDAVVTDPPYGLEFMGKDWDSYAPKDRKNASVWDGRRQAQDGWEEDAAARSGKGGGGPSYKSSHKGAKRCTVCGKRAFSGSPCVCDEPEWILEHRQEAPSAMIGFQKFSEAWAREAYRVLKPGGMIAAFGGTRTFHRLACAIEDAGFEIRDSVAWVHGQGFPKNLNVSKALAALPSCSCGAGSSVGQGVGVVDAAFPALAVGAGDGAEARSVGLAGQPADSAIGVGPKVLPAASGGLRDVDAIHLDSDGEALPVVLGPLAVAGAAQRQEVVGLVGGVKVNPETLRNEVMGQESISGSAVGTRSVAPNDGGSDVRPPAPLVFPLAATPSGVASASEAVGVVRTHAGAGAVDATVSPSAKLAAAHNADVDAVSGAPHVPNHTPKMPVRCEACGGLRGPIPDGLGTALKPAFEPVVVARKPLVGTVAANVERYGTGALNIDGCRIAGDVPSVPQPVFSRDMEAGFGASAGRNGEMSQAAGRWPANVILDESQAAELDRQSGDRPSAGHYKDEFTKTRRTTEDDRAGWIFKKDGHPGNKYAGDTGGASRFFYTAKADSSERPRVDGVAHPTVKPLDLMRYLVRLVTPPGGVVLEPFAGSGTTLEACIVEGFRCIGIEREADYLPLILARITKPIEVTLL